MTSLATFFCGIQLANPVIVASCPATENVAGILSCAEAGAGAIITKSISDYDYMGLKLGARRTAWSARGFSACSTFRRETLTREAGTAVIREASSLTDVPVVASVTSSSLAVESWLPTCEDVVAAGAKALQLDLFYLPQPISAPGTFERLLALLGALSEQLSVPVIPKLNIDIPAYLAAQYLPQAGVAGVALLDSVRVPSPVSIERKGGHSYRFLHNPGMSSLFGAWQMPLTQHYAMVMGRHTHLQMCAGGGIANVEDAIELIMLGATTVQVASLVLANGYSAIGDIVDGIRSYMRAHGFSSMQELQGLALQQQRTDLEHGDCEFVEAKATILAERCVACGRCLSLSFCSAISGTLDSVSISKAKCDGCGFCVPFCPKDAIVLSQIS